MKKNEWQPATLKKQAKMIERSLDQITAISKSMTGCIADFGQPSEKELN